MKRFVFSACHLGIWFVAGWMVGPVRADSAIDLLSGFDQQRIEAAYPPANDEAFGELAKLVYRLQTVSGDALGARVGDGSEVAIGDAVAFEGAIVRSQMVPIPESLVEFLEFTHLYFIDARTEIGSVARIVASDFPSDAVAGDKIALVGVALEVGSTGQATSIAAPRVRWSPRTTPKAGWQLLSDANFDLAMLAGAKQRSRQPLEAEDGEVFYALLASADQVGERDDLPSAEPIEPVELLKRPRELSGDWLTLVMETVQITRIAVTEPVRQDQLGQDHYFQIDAVVDLGNVVVKIERPDPNSGPPAIFENRYPVSVVSAKIPDFLRRRIFAEEGGEAVVSQHRSLIAVDGFYFRLWSYQSEFMNQHGGGDQFGPLLVAARIQDRTPTAEDPAGVQVIGWIAAFTVIAGILFFWIWSRVMATRDRQASERRRQREADRVQLPS